MPLPSRQCSLGGLCIDCVQVWKVFVRPIDLGLFKFHFPNEPRPDAWTKKVISDGGYNGFNLVKESGVCSFYSVLHEIIHSGCWSDDVEWCNLMS